MGILGSVPRGFGEVLRGGQVAFLKAGFKSPGFDFIKVGKYVICILGTLSHII